MRNVTNEFKESIKNLDVYSDGLIQIIDSLATLTFDRKKIIKFEISGSSYVNEKILGNVSTSTITVELLGDQTKLISKSNSKFIRPLIGIKVVDTFEYVQLQDFLVIDSKYNDTTNVTTLYGSDYTYKLNVKYTDSNTYPMTLRAYYESVILFCGLSYSEDSFLNEDFMIESKPFSDGTLCKEIVGRIAELAMSYICVNDLNETRVCNAFKTISNLNSHDFLSQYTFDELAEYTHDELSELETNSSIDSVNKRAYWSLKLKEHIYKFHGINTLTLGISQVVGESNSVSNQTHLAIDGSIEINVLDNPFINTEEKRQSVIDSMFSVVDGYKIIPFNLEYRGFPHIEINDLINITQMDESVIQTTIHEYYLMFNGGLRGKLASYSPSISDTEYKNESTLKERLKNAEIRVNKAEASIELVAEDVDGLTGRVQATEVKLEPEAFTISVEQITSNQYGETISNVNKNFIFNIDGLEINNSVNTFAIKIDETEMGFYDGASKVAYMNNNELRIKQGVVENNLIIGVHKIEKFNNNITVFKYIGEE